VPLLLLLLLLLLPLWRVHLHAAQPCVNLCGVCWVGCLLACFEALLCWAGMFGLL
jgi:hypothetical protein